VVQGPVAGRLAKEALVRGQRLVGHAADREPFARRKRQLAEPLELGEQAFGLCCPGLGAVSRHDRESGALLRELAARWSGTSSLGSATHEPVEPHDG